MSAGSRDLEERLAAEERAERIRRARAKRERAREDFDRARRENLELIARLRELARR